MYLPPTPPSFVFSYNPITMLPTGGYGFPTPMPPAGQPAMMPIPPRAWPKPAPKPVKLSEKVDILKEKDPLQSYPVRFLGYANELTTAWWEAIEGTFGKPVAKWSHRVTTALATLYSLADTWEQGREEHLEHQNSPSVIRRREVILESMATGLFQLGASVYVPPMVIECIQKKAGHWLDQPGRNLSPWLKAGTKSRGMAMAALGTLAIPVIAKPIDTVFHMAIKHLYWPVVSFVVKRNEEQEAKKPKSTALDLPA